MTLELINLTARQHPGGGEHPAGGEHDGGSGRARRLFRVKGGVRVAAWLSTVCLVVGACGGSSKEATPSTTDALEATNAPAIATEEALPSLPVPTIGGLDTIDAASQNLWDSWRDDDRDRALLYATEEAVNALFATPWAPEARNQGCDLKSGQPRCIYTLRDPQRRVIVARVVVLQSNGSGYFVEQVVAPAGELKRAPRLDSEVVDDSVVLSDETLPSESIANLEPPLPEDGATLSDLDSGAVDAVGGSDLGTVSDSTDATGGSTTSSDGTGGDITTGPGVDGATPATIAGGGNASNSGSSDSGGANTRRKKKTTKKKVVTKKKSTKRNRATAPNDGGGESAPSPDPSPAPSPAPDPAPGPVQVGGETVNTVG